MEFVDTGTNLANCGYYKYYSANIGGTSWQSVFCSGAGCEGMITINAGQSSLDTVVAGGEGYDSAAHWGTIYGHNHGYLPTGGANYQPWCYSTAWHVGTANVPTVCYNAGDGWNDSWDASY